MAIFSLSDIIIASTLLLNAVALLASPPKRSSGDSASSSPVADPSACNPPSTHTNPTSDDSEVSYPTHTPHSLTNTEISEPTMQERCILMLRALRRLSCVIVLWNIFFAVLLLFIFPR
ncbi:hypothetical protein EON65_58745 [archaeon]|nr:MAG: hypothetical protein EON65_58745 [archaeon]